MLAREAMQQPAPSDALRVVAPSAPQPLQQELNDQQLRDIIFFGGRRTGNNHAASQQKTDNLFVPAVDHIEPIHALTVLGKNVVTDTPGFREETLYVAGDHPHLGRLALAPYTSVETEVTRLILPAVTRTWKALENPHFGRPRRIPAVGPSERKETKKTYKPVEIQVFPERQFVFIKDFISGMK